MSVDSQELLYLDDQSLEDAPLLKRCRTAEDAEMDITPMIDVTFLLLIFFMVASTMDQQATVDLAKARNGDSVTQRNSFVISVGKGGFEAAPVYLADNTGGAPLDGDFDVQREQIVQAVQRAQRAERKQQVIIMADLHTSHRDVARVIKAVSQVQGMGIHLAVNEEN